MLRLALALRSLPFLDRVFIPDDTYYFLSIARSLAHGHGPRADAVHLTNGFQPLLAFLLTPVFWVVHSPDGGLRSALVLLAICDGLTTFFLARLAHRLAGPVAAVIAAAIWALSPVALGNALSGMETSLAVLLEVALVLAWCVARERRTPTRYAIVGVVAGLAVLARIDALLLVGALCVVELIQRGRWVTRAALMTGAVVVAPWWIYSTVTFGSPMPESGQAVHQLLTFFHLSGATRLGWAGAIASGGPVGTPIGFRLHFIGQPSGGPELFALVTGVLLLVAWWWWRSLPLRGDVIGPRGDLGARDDGRVSAAFVVFGVGLMVVYGTYLSAIWFTARYIAPVSAVLTLVAATAASWLWARRRVVVVRATVVVLVAAAVALQGRTDVHYLRDRAPATVGGLYNDARGYRDPAKEIVASAPAGAVVGSLQSGALGYYGYGKVTVVNLDGVVNGAAARALREHRLAAYARSQHIGYLDDWWFNLDNFVNVSGEPGLTTANFQPVASARPQGPDVFTLVLVHWPNGSH